MDKGVVKMTLTNIENIYANTFSITARGSEDNKFGVAVATAVPGVGALVPFVSESGAIATQAMVNTQLGKLGIKLLNLGIPIDKAIPVLLDQDSGSSIRQIHGVDKNGQNFAHSGRDCVKWFGHIRGQSYTIAGNMLTGEETLEAMANSFEETDPSTKLSERLLIALKAGERAGGDKRGKDSAALLIASPNPKFYHNLRVDYHSNPVERLYEIYEIAKKRAEEREEEYRSANTDITLKY